MSACMDCLGCNWSTIFADALSLSHTIILDSSNLKELACDNFKLDENGRKLSKKEENAVGKEETARYEQFLLLSTVFSKELYSKHVETRACLGKS